MTEQQVAEAAARAGGEVVARYFRDFANVAHEVKAGEPSYNRVSVADLEYELSPWDFAAGRLFVEEAGGCVTTCNNHPLPLAKPIRRFPTTGREGSTASTSNESLALHQERRMLTLRVRRMAI